MCDARAIWENSSYNNSFYQQYFQNHARMTEWIQNLHQNIHQTGQNCFHHGNHTCHHNRHPHQQLPAAYQGHYVPQQGHYFPQQGRFVPQQGHFVPQQGHYVPQQGHYVPQQGHYVPQQGHHVPQQGHHVPQQEHHVPQQGHHVPQQGDHVPQQGHHVPPQGHHAADRNVQHQRRSFRQYGNDKHNSQKDTPYRSRSEASIGDIEGENNEDEGAWVLNTDAILAFRAQKEKSAPEVNSEESFELVDTMLNENFEFVELDEAGQLRKIFGKPTAPDASGDVEYDRESRIVLYGDRADRIAGLETSLEIMFNHINDLHQPVEYPRV